MSKLQHFDTITLIQLTEDTTTGFRNSYQPKQNKTRKLKVFSSSRHDCLIATAPVSGLFQTLDKKTHIFLRKWSVVFSNQTMIIIYLFIC